MKKTTANALVTAAGLSLAVMAIVAFSFFINQPPAVIPADASPELFSAERAAKHLPYIASRPNPLGSKANAEVREYIVEQLELKGLEPQVQKAEVFYADRAAYVQNVMARIAGSGGEERKTILFMGHYDTVITAPGASDNGAAVVSLLELIRLLSHQPPVHNDLIFLFPDGEEYGLFGAQAFVGHHPWAKDVDLVINLEAMGTRGQSLMFETGENNLELIRQFAQSVPYPKAISLSVEVYNRMPNSTDLYVFKHEGYQGLNFAYIGNSFDYHTAGDNIENTDLRSIQHHGSAITALALTLGNTMPDLASNQNAVYFNTMGYGFFWYPYSFVPVIGIVVLVLVLLAIAFAALRQKITLWNLLFGFVSGLVLLLSLYAIFHSLYIILGSFYSGPQTLLLRYNQPGILLGFALVGAAVSAIYFAGILHGLKLWHAGVLPLLSLVFLAWAGELSWIKAGIALAGFVYLALVHRKPMAVLELTSGALLMWSILMVMVSFLMPGGSYLFVWPLLFGLIPFVAVAAGPLKTYDGFYIILLLWVAAIPVLAWFPEMINLLMWSMGLQMAGLMMVLLGLMMLLLIPVISLITRVKPWLIPGVLMLAGLVVLLNSTLALQFDARHRKPNSVVHATHHNSGESYWLQFAQESDEWTEQFLGISPDTVARDKFYPHLSGTFLASKSTSPGLSAPEISVLRDTILQGERVLELHVLASPEVSELNFYFRAEEHDIAIRVGDTGKNTLNNLANTSWKRFFYFAPPEEGVTLILYTSPELPLEMQLMAMDYSGIPEDTSFNERPPHMMNGGDRTLLVLYQQFE